MKGNRRTKKMGMLIGQKRINQYRTNQGGGGMDIATNKKKKKPVQKKMSGGILEYKTKGGGKISTKKSISKIGQKLLGMKNIKRKPFKKKNLGGILGGGLLPVLPATIMGKKPLMKLAESGVGGMLPMAFAKQQSRKKQKADMAGSNRMTEMQRMKMGGQVKRKKSIDGIATKGKTRAI